MTSVLTRLAGILAMLPLAGLAEPPKAVPVEEEAPAGYTTNLNFTYRSEAGEQRDRKIYLWYPAAAEAKRFTYHGMQEGLVALDAPVVGGRHPLVVFSHGFWGAAHQTIFLMEGLARAGYIVAALHHDDAMPNQHRKRIELPNFVDAKGWDDGKFFDRKEDMTALLDHLLAVDRDPGSALFGRIQRDAIGAAGHSLGGYTALGLAGARASWKDERISAALLLSPYVHPFYFNGNLKAVEVPVMFQGGTRDVGITPFLKSIYKRITSPKYYLVLKKVGHYGWTNFATVGRSTSEVLREGNTKLMTDYGVAFFDCHLCGKDRKAALGDRAGALHRWLSTP